MPTVSECATQLRSKETTATELLERSLAHIDATEPELGAYLTVTKEQAHAQAKKAQAMLDSGNESPLCGVPVAIKDVLCWEGIETTAASKILQGFRPPYTATAVQKLLDLGAVIVGKTNCDEFAMGSSNENSAFKEVGNPWDVKKVPGGSSGGSAATVAAGSVAMSLGTDTGGSIRQPAALSGVVGYKPTYGRVSRYGLIAFASSLDQIGPFTRTVEDCAITYQAIAGNDPLDSTSSPKPLDDPLATLKNGVKGLRLGVPKEYFVEGIEPGVRDTVMTAISELEKLGASIEEVSLPTTEAGLATYYIIAPAECSSNLSRYDGVRFGQREPGSLTEMYRGTRGKYFGDEVKRRVMLGTYALSSGYYDAYYRKAQKVRTVMTQEFEQVFAKVDAVLSPTSPVVAFDRGAKKDPLALYLCDILTIPANLAGLPGISLPCGFVGGLPVGLQIVGARFADAKVMQIAYAYEQAAGWMSKRPEMAAAK